MGETAVAGVDMVILQILQKGQCVASCFHDASTFCLERLRAVHDNQNVHAFTDAMDEPMRQRGVLKGKNTRRAYLDSQTMPVLESFHFRISQRNVSIDHNSSY